MRALLLLTTLLAAPALANPAPAPAPAPAPEAKAPAPRAIHGYAALAIAPAGDRLAAVEPLSADHAAILIRDSAQGHVLATIDPCATCTYAGLTFAPDGALAFIARDKARGTTLLMLAQGGKSETLATIEGLASTPRFSPDGRRIAALVTLNATKETGAIQAGARQIGEIGDHSDEQRLALFDRATTLVGPVTPLSPADRYIYEYDWAPDGRSLIVTSALGNGDNNWWVATLDAVDAATGALRNIARPTTQINMPRVSPDGQTIAYIGGLMSDFGSIGGDVWTVPSAGGTPVNRTPGDKATVNSLAWTRGGLRGTRLAGAAAQLVDFSAAAPRVLWSRPANLAAGEGRAAWSADGRKVATVAQDFAHAPAILAGPADAPRAITHDNDALPALARAQNRAWTNEGFDIQGWLLAPPGADWTKQRSAPMVTIVHGGPAAASEPRYVAGGLAADLLAAGYFVFYPNPRGSYGQGEAFTQANRRDFGGGDLRDILTGIDSIVSDTPVDGNRLGLTGGSYGGFMSMWANTQTNRFKAIVAAAGLSNWVSYYGTNGIDQWMLPYFGKSLYEDPAAYRAASAIEVIKQARTPTFIYVGERDIEVPPTQSVEYWHALRDLGVPTSLVIYPDEGHGLRQGAHSKDAATRTIAWFNRWLGAGK